MTNLSFSDMLALIDDRSAALRSAAALAGFDARVPSCPDWTVADLIAHLGGVHIFWTAVVGAGEAAGPPDPESVGDAKPGPDLLAWSADASTNLIGELRNAGPNRMCWTWWESTGAPMTSGAVARHQVQEAAGHAYDTQLAAGRPEPLPPAAAADGVDEYLAVELRSNGPWPYDPATVVLETGAGGSWLLDLGHFGVNVLRGDEHGNVKETATVTADPSDMVLAFYRRDTIGQLRIDGDADLVSDLLAWPNLD
jgi:uncharacterized protein (TIGR03083 family)